MSKQKNLKGMKPKEDDMQPAKVTFHFREGVTKGEEEAALCLFCQVVEAIEVDLEPLDQDQDQPFPVKGPDTTD
jgi:hypothetical protein